MLELFINLLKGDWFHFYDNPSKKMMKMDSSHRLTPEGRRVTDPGVAVVPDQKHVASKSIYDQSENGEF